MNTGRITALPDRVGLETLKGLAYIGGLAQLAGESAYITFIGPFRGQRLRPQRALHQAMAVGVQAVPIISLISFFVGLIMALESAYELRRLGAMQFLANAVAIAIVRELGPLITAIIVIGRSGSAFAAEIGTMKVTEEIDALKTMALRPVAFLVAPKFQAMLLMVPCLTIWGDFMGVMGGCLFGVAASRFHLRVVSPGHARRPTSARYLHRPGEERTVFCGDHRRWLPGGFLDRSRP